MNSPVDDETATGPSGPTAITSLPCRSRTCRRRLGTAALAIEPISATVNTNRPTIFERRERRNGPTSPINDEGACAEPCAETGSLRTALHHGARDRALTCQLFGIHPLKGRGLGPARGGA